MHNKKKLNKDSCNTHFFLVVQFGLVRDSSAVWRLLWICCSRGMSERYTYRKQRICFSNSGSVHFHVSWLSDFIFYQKPLYKSLHQSFFYSFITIWPSESGVALHYSTILPWILLFRHLTSIFQTFVTWLRDNYDYRNVSWEIICI